MAAFVEYLPVFVGAFGLIFAAYSLHAGSRHPNGMVFIAAFTTLLCGSNIIQSFVFGSDGIDVKFRKKLALLERGLESNTLAMAGITSAVNSLSAQDALSSIRTVRLTEGDVRSNDDLSSEEMAYDGKYFLESEYCKDNKEICEAFSGDFGAVSGEDLAKAELSIKKELREKLSETQGYISESEEIFKSLDDGELPPNRL